MKRLSIGLLVVLIVVAAVLPATAAAADPPKTDYLYFEIPVGPVQPGYEARTGAAYHLWDVIWQITTVSDDPRFDGIQYSGPWKLNCLWSRWVDPAGTCVGGGDIVIIPTLQPQPDSYWEGHFECPQARLCKAALHGHGAFEGLQAIQGVVMVPDPANPGELIPAVQGVVIGQ